MPFAHKSSPYTAELSGSFYVLNCYLLEVERTLGMFLLKVLFLLLLRLDEEFRACISSFPLHQLVESCSQVVHLQGFMVRKSQLLPLLLAEFQEVIDKGLDIVLLVLGLAVLLFAVGVEDFVDIMLERVLVVGHGFPMPLPLVHKHVPAAVPVSHQSLRDAAVETAHSESEALVQQFVSLEELVRSTLDGPIDVQDAEGEIAGVLVGNEVGLVLGRDNRLDEGVEVLVVVA